MERDLQKSGLKLNINNIDRSIRFALGTFFIGTIIFLTFQPLGWKALLPLAGAYMIHTAIVRWDPLYTVMAELLNRCLSSIKFMLIRLSLIAEKPAAPGLRKLHLSKIRK